MFDPRRLIVATSIAVFGLACAHKNVRIDPPAEAAKPGEVALRYDWIKDKGRKFDLRLAVTNGTDQSILFYLDDLHCFRGEEEGKLTHTFFNTGHRTFKYHAGAGGEYNMVCQLTGTNRGDYKVRLTKVYENPSGDGITAGKQIGGPVEIVQKVE